MRALMIAGAPRCLPVHANCFKKNGSYKAICRANAHACSFFAQMCIGISFAMALPSALMSASHVHI